MRIYGTKDCLVVRLRQAENACAFVETTHRANSEHSSLCGQAYRHSGTSRAESASSAMALILISSAMPKAAQKLRCLKVAAYSGNPRVGQTLLSVPSGAPPFPRELWSVDPSSPHQPHLHILRAHLRRRSHLRRAHPCPHLRHPRRAMHAQSATTVPKVLRYPCLAALGTSPNRSMLAPPMAA